MIEKLFDHFDDSARVWIFPLRNALTTEQSARLGHALQMFAKDWKSHGAPLQASATIVADRFVVIACDGRVVGASGCAIDGFDREVERLVQSEGNETADPSWIYFEKGGIQALQRDDFEKLCQEGTFSRGQIVYNNAVTTLGDLRNGRWRLPIENSWHARYL